MAEFQYEGITFHYEVIGEGCPFIFSHGLTWDLYRSQELLGRLPGCQLITWDMRAHGRTTPTGSAAHLSFQRFAGDLAALMDHLAIDAAVIGGISMGAAVSLEFAAQHPERLLGLLLLQPAWLPDQHPENLDLFMIVGDLLELFGVDEGLRHFELWPAFQRLRASAPDAAASLIGQFHKPQAVERAVRLRRIPADRPLRDWERIAGLQTPTLVVGTEADPIHPTEYAEQWARRIAGADLRTITPKSIDPDHYLQRIRQEVQHFLQTLPIPPLPFASQVKVRS